MMKFELFVRLYLSRYLNNQCSNVPQITYMTNSIYNNKITYLNNTSYVKKSQDGFERPYSKIISVSSSGTGGQGWLELDGEVKRWVGYKN